MGTKRRSMFNPKFKNVRPKRWEQGRKLLGIPTDAEIQAKKLAEEQEASKLQSEQEAKAKLEAEKESLSIEAEEAKVKFARAEEVENKTEPPPKVKLSKPAAKSKPKAKAKPKAKTTRSRKTRAKKE